MHISGLERRVRHQLLRFVERHPRAHHHLDWEPIAQWIRHPRNMVALAWVDDVLAAAMIFSPPHHQTAWLRLLALPPHGSHRYLMALWHYLEQQMRGDVRQIAAMSGQAWVIDALEYIGLRQAETVINLLWTTQPLPAVSTPRPKVRRLRLGEMSKVLAVDHAAFLPLWQMREDELRVAQRASHYTVASLGRQIVGYQLSMHYDNTMHLGRLATLPAFHNQGIGSALLHDLLTCAQQRHIYNVTVNTQRSNTPSRRLYERFGFEENGPEFSVHTRQLT